MDVTKDFLKEEDQEALEKEAEKVAKEFGMELPSDGRGTEEEEEKFQSFLTKVGVTRANYSNSPLVSYTRISPNRSVPRANAISRITIHCVVGQCTVEALGAVFAPTSRQASSNYGIGYDGRVGMYCPESDRSWCSSSPDNDNKAITIEVASDTYAPYRVKDAAYNTVIKLCADICKRYGKTKLIWLGDKEKTLAYTPKSNEMVMTAHRWFAPTICPGDYLYGRFGDIANKVNLILEEYKWETVWVLRDKNGTLQKGWKKVNDKWYYLGDDGIMRTGWQKVNGKWFLLSSKGDMLTGWQLVNGKWYYMDSDGYMKTGWLKDGKWYLLSGNGDMLTGWQKVNGKWYYLTPKNDGTHKTGEMWTGWLKDKGKWYYLDPKDGYMYTGTHTIDGKTYKFDSNGALVE